MSNIIEFQAFKDKREREVIADKVVAIDGRAITVVYGNEQFDLAEWIEWVPFTPSNVVPDTPMQITTGEIARNIYSGEFVLDCWGEKGFEETTGTGSVTWESYKHCLQ
jgi:hypothetical protein